MTAFTIASDPSNHPKPPSRENFKAFLVNGGVESDFAFPVSWNERSITVGTAQRVGLAMAFPTAMIKLPKSTDLPDQTKLGELRVLSDLIRRVELTANVLRTEMPESLTRVINATKATAHILLDKVSSPHQA